MMLRTASDSVQEWRCSCGARGFRETVAHASAGFRTTTGERQRDCRARNFGTRRESVECLRTQLRWKYR